MAKTTNHNAKQPKLAAGDNTHQELVLLRMEAKAMRDMFTESFDTIIDRINRLLPAEDEGRFLRYKNFTPKEIGDFLDGKIT